MKLSKEGIQKLTECINGKENLEDIRFSSSDFVDFEDYLIKKHKEASHMFLLTYGETIGFLRGIGHDDQAEKLTEALWRY